MKLLDENSYVPVLEAAIIGCVSGAAAAFLSMAISCLGALRVHLSDSIHPQLALCLFGLIGGLISGLLVEKVAPEASGSGIPQVKAWLDRVMMALDFRIAVVKFFSGIIALGSGFFLGREGPTVQLGAALAEPLSRLLPTTAAYKRELIAAGAGAGLAAAFNAPLAGIVFVLEELLKEIKPSSVIITTVACSASSLMLGLLRPSHFRSTVETLSSNITFSTVDLPFYLVLGLLSGIFGVLFNSGIIWSLNFNRKVFKIPLFLRTALAGLLSGAIISLLPESFHNYAAMRGLIVAGDPNWITVLIGFAAFYILTFIAYGSGAPGGLFAPSLAIGSALGYLLGHCEQLMVSSGSPAAFALVGMGAFFSAVGRVPLTAIVITFELTTNFTLLPPLMLVCVISAVVADLLSKGGLYEILMRWNGINLQSLSATAGLRILRARDVMLRIFESVNSKLLIRDLLPIFSSTNQRGFPVIERNRLIGVITQTDLSKLKQMDSLDSTTVGEIMTPHPVAVSPFDSLDEILFLFSRYKFTWLPVVFHDQIEGIILQSDVLNALFLEEEKRRE